MYTKTEKSVCLSAYAMILGVTSIMIGTDKHRENSYSPT